MWIVAPCWLSFCWEVAPQDLALEVVALVRDSSLQPLTHFNLFLSAMFSFIIIVVFVWSDGEYFAFA